MRARQRHFNPGHSGAKAVFDARFISGLSNGSAITTWSDRSGQANDATQSNSSFRPTFQTNVQGGNPSTRYNGTNQRFTAPTIDAKTFIVVFTPNTTGINKTFYGIQSNSSGALDALYIQIGDPTRKPVFIRATTSAVDGGANFRTVHTAISNNAPCIFTGKRSDTTMTSWVVGADEQSKTVSDSLKTADGPSAIGAGYYNNTIVDFLPGDIFALALYDIEMEKPLIKRLEHSAAITFKLACS